jgi:predicted ribosome quality control (RQC) complex YloA/Tae2 family protein
MTNREMLNILKDIETFDVHIKTVIYKIIEDTFDPHICNVDEYEISDDKVIVQYEYYYRGYGAYDVVHIPIDWFNEGFNYVLAYEEQQQKIKKEQEKKEAKRKKRAAEKRKKAKELKEKKEYNTYLKLKEKYENGELI